MAYSKEFDSNFLHSSVIGPWRISSRSSSGNCVEVCTAADAMLVRNSNNRGGGMLSFTFSEWEAFVAGVKLGEFDL